MTAKPPTIKEARGFRQSIEYEELDKEAGIRAEAVNTTILECGKRRGRHTYGESGKYNNGKFSKRHN